MISIQRAILDDTDISVAVNDYRSSAASFSYVSGDYLYIGQEMPFNNLWFEIGTPNAASGAVVSIQNWWGNQWVNCVDVVDQTTALSSTGRLSWSTDYLKAWDVEQTTRDKVTGLEDFDIYWMYWARLSWDSSFTGSPTVKYIGQKFSDDAALYSHYPDLNNANLKASFAVGKTDWVEQAYMATEVVIRDLQSRKIIFARGQVLDPHRLEDAAIHRTAEIIYAGMGKAYEVDMAKAHNRYKAAMDKDFFRVDLNASGNLEPIEKVISTTFMSR